MRSASARRPALLAALALAACGGGDGPAPIPPPVAGHTLPVTVNGARCAAATSADYVNKPCVQVTVCVPGTTTCHAVDDVLLDTGSFGLRLFRQALPLDLPPLTSGGNPLATCARFGDGSAQWGPVVSAAVRLGDAGEVTTPIQVIDAAFARVPPACGTPEASPAEAGLNGILGVGVFLQDCGPFCAGTAFNDVYFACGPGGCAGARVPLNRQLQNPAALLVGLDNGLVVDLPAVGPGGAASATGEVRFGIGRTPDTEPGGVTAYPKDAAGRLVNRVAGGPAAAGFLDTGSNGLFVAVPGGSGLSPCAAPDGAWLCTPATVPLDADFRTRTGAFGPLTAFEVADAQGLFGSGFRVFRNLAGGGFPGLGDDWGLPFHLGRKVYVGFEGRTSALGTGPYVAF
jgi:hypothetical protein